MTEVHYKAHVLIIDIHHYRSALQVSQDSIWPAVTRSNPALLYYPLWERTRIVVEHARRAWTGGLPTSRVSLDLRYLSLDEMPCLKIFDCDRS